MSNVWTPHVTVATVISREKQKRYTEYLMVKEKQNGEIVYNQPAGHLEKDETLTEAAIRETLEETACSIELNGYLGVYRLVAPNGETYIRHAFTASLIQQHTDRELDSDIIETEWLSYEDVIQKSAASMRSVLVRQTIEDARNKNIYPLELVHEASDRF